jgi:hypothetical protein
MKNKALVIIITFMLGSAGVLSPAFYASAQASSEGSSVQEAAEEEPEKEAQIDQGASAEGAEGTENSVSGSSKADGAGGILQQGAEFGQELYKKMDEAVDSVDKASLRGSIRDALEEMDRMGISPTAIAENTFGIKPASSNGSKMPENTLIEEAERTVRKKTEGFFTVLWDGFLDTLGNMISTGFAIFGSQKGSTR